MKEIIPPVDKEILKAELKPEFLLRHTNKAGNLIYDITYHDAPNVMREIGRLREHSYRQGGGASGNEVDIDLYDTMPKPYHQLIVWNPDEEEIIGGYRYIMGSEVDLDEEDQPIISSSHLFRYSEFFRQERLRQSIEFGRAFVQPKYTTREAGMKALFALDNIWDGLGAILYNHPELKWMFGKVTIHPGYDPTAQQLIYAYLERYCQGPRGLIQPKNPIRISHKVNRLADETFVGEDAQENYKILQRAVRGLGTVIPAMFSAYLNVTDQLLFFGSCINDELGNACETGIVVPVEDIYPEKWDRYVGSYIEEIEG